MVMLGIAEALAERRILIVEDEALLALSLRDLLELKGARVVGPVPTVERALALIATEPEIHVAYLDMSLRGESFRPVADALIERGIPFVIVSGYDVPLPDRYSGYPRVQKPAAVDTVLGALVSAVESGPSRSSYGSTCSTSAAPRVGSLPREYLTPKP